MIIVMVFSALEMNMRLESLNEALLRLGLSKEKVRDNLLRLHALHKEAVVLIGNSDGSTVDGYDYGYLYQNGFDWVQYRERCYPVKEGSKRYMSCLETAKRLKQIEEEIKQIDGSYNPETQCVYIIKKRLETEWVDEKGDTRALISV
jgi:hypothetical protein